MLDDLFSWSNGSGCQCGRTDSVLRAGYVEGAESCVDGAGAVGDSGASGGRIEGGKDAAARMLTRRCSDRKNLVSELADDWLRARGVNAISVSALITASAWIS
jgi:hypothetical protein